MSKSLEFAANYLQRGWQPLPVPYRSKNPNFSGWQNFTTTENDLPKYFNGKPQNIGVLLGSKSKGLTDVDLDSPDAVKIADFFLPPTKSEFGRNSKPRSHRLYYSDFPKTEQFINPFVDEKNAMIVEIRSTGGQTVFPPSTHESGELIEWFSDGTPKKIESRELRRRVALLACACLILHFWRVGIRQKITLAICGAFLRNGFTEAETENFIRAICHASNDEETPMRLNTVETTAGKIRDNKNVCGLPTLAELTDKKLVDTLCKWLGIESRNIVSEKNSVTGQLSNLLSATLFDGKLILEITAEGKKQKVTAKDQDEIFGVDVFNLSESTKRAKFVESLKDRFNENEQTEISRELIQLADKTSNLAIPREEKGETVQTTFQELKDGRIIEQIRGGFAVYEPDTNEHCILESVTDSDGTTYTPVEDELFQKDGGIQLANDLTEYGTETELITDIENYLSANLDLKPLYLKITALYILFTYRFDKVLELSYLNPTGDMGSGKSRFGQTVCLASRRGLALVTPSAASLYRIVDKYKPTLFIDEFNSDANSDDAAAIIQILNAGYQKTAQIPRLMATGDGNYKTELFDPYCPKIIGSLKQSKSIAFNSRCNEVQMEQTHRNNIPLRLSPRLLNAAQIIRNKITLWRLRNFKNDFEAELDRAEFELRKAEITPRSIQINIPLFALMKDEDFKREFINLLKGRDEILNEEKRNSFDGELVQTLHTILFDINEQNQAELRIVQPSENELCEDLRIEKIVSMMTESRILKAEIKNNYIGKRINGLGLRSKQILSRKSAYHKKSAIIFDSHRLKVIFKNYGLTVPTDFSLDHLDQSDNSNESDDLDWSKEDSADEQNETSLDHLNFTDYNNKSDWSKWSKEKTAIQEQNNFYSELVCEIEKNGMETMEVDEVI